MYKCHGLQKHSNISADDASEENFHTDMETDLQHENIQVSQDHSNYNNWKHDSVFVIISQQEEIEYVTEYCVVLQKYVCGSTRSCILIEQLDRILESRLSMS